MSQKDERVEDKGGRVVVTKGMIGIFAMQVCAVEDATDEEILEVCNRENPAGTTNGWVEVVRKIDRKRISHQKQHMPVKCGMYPTRRHFLVYC